MQSAALFELDLWNGGASFGPRFLVPSIPFLIIPIFLTVEFTILSRNTLVKWIGASLIGVLFAFSIVVESIGAITSPTAPFSDSSFFHFLFVETSFPTILKGNLFDLGYVLFGAGNSTAVPDSSFGISFWIFFIVFLSAAFIILLTKIGISTRGKNKILATQSFVVETNLQ